MSEKKILPFGDPTLRRKAQPITEFDHELKRLLMDMTDTLYAAEGRAGLAAPQIGVLKRVVVMDCGKGLIQLINPEILERRGEQTGLEACLSFPGHTGIVKRADFVKVKTMTGTGRDLVFEGTGFLARCIQHELDHLDGILYVDHIQDNQLYNDHTRRRVDLREVLRISQIENDEALLFHD